MKLYIRESNYLFEDIEAVRKYYPNIPDDIFMKLIALDPTYRNNNSLGKYGKWILNLYNKGNLSEDEFEEVAPLLDQFTIYRNRIQNKDLNSYKSLQELSDILASVVDDDSMLTNRQKVRFLKNVKAGRVNVSAEDDYDVVLDTPEFIVYVPNTHEASMKLGKGTNWCTAHENPRWYKHYTSYGGKLYIIKEKSTGNRWQYSDSTEDFLDEYDEKFDYVKLLQKDSDLSKFFAKFLRVDLYDFDGTYTYNGEPVPPVIISSITKVVIPHGTLRICNKAFNGCENLTEVTIPNSVISIGDGAFSDCPSLTKITIPDSVTSIGGRAFEACVNLNEVNIPNSVESIGASAFSLCEKLTEITIPDGVTIIGDCVFNACENLAAVTLPNSVTSIGVSAFYGCENLTAVTIPNSVTSIGPYAFRNCYNLTEVTIPNSVTDIGESAFTQCYNLTEITIPDGVTSIRVGTFSSCKNLTAVTIPDSVTSIGDYAFSGCRNLTIYTDNEYVIDYCNNKDISVEPKSKFRRESLFVQKKLNIREDTTCVPSKTSYIDEDGLDANGVYYFGKKPNPPISWRKFQKKGAKKNMKIKESYYDMEDVTYDLLKTKQIYDYDGFTTDYSLYGVRMNDSEDFHYYVGVFGDLDMYDPNEGSTDFDFETDDYDEALEWFDNYTGYEYDDEDEYDESYEYKYSDSLSEEYLAEDSDDLDEIGQFMSLDDVVSGFTGNMGEDDIDKAISYLSQVSAKLGKKDKFNKITYYACNAEWLDPLKHKDMFDSFNQIYKNGKYDGYLGTYKGKKFVVDHFDTRVAFDMYATDEETIREILEEIQKEFE